MSTTAERVGALDWSPTRELTADLMTMRSRVMPRDAERQSSWRCVARQRVYFGHQSVGQDILGGLAELSRRDALGLRIIESREPSEIPGPAIAHFLAGRNEDPASKNDALLSVLDARPAPDGAIALLKYCYVDMGPHTDIWRLFTKYRRFVSALQRRHPDVTLMHVTMPLTTSRHGVRDNVRRLLGQSHDRDVAIARHRYNTLLREAFAGRAPFFDLAAIEATREDGSRAGFLRRGEWSDVLAPEYTHDGGHLCAHGARRVAAGLLDALAAATAGGSEP